MHIAACQAAGFEPQVGFQTDDYNVDPGPRGRRRGHLADSRARAANVRDDIVIRSLGKEAPVRHVSAATLAGGYRSPATEAMLEMLQGAAAQYPKRRSLKLRGRVSPI